MTDDVGLDLTSLTAEVLCAYLSHNALDADELPDLIRSTYAAFSTITSAAPIVAASERPVPAVSIRKSLASPDAILSLIDGKSYKTLKRHLAGHGLTPAEYRQRYALPSDYPMVATSYSEHRRGIAAARRFGQRGNSTNQDGPTAVELRPAVKDAPGTPGAADLVDDVASETTAPTSPAPRPRKRATAVATSSSSAVPTSTAASSPPPRQRLKLKLAADEAPSS